MKSTLLPSLLVASLLVAFALASEFQEDYRTCRDIAFGSRPSEECLQCCEGKGFDWWLSESASAYSRSCVCRARLSQLFISSTELSRRDNSEEEESE